MPAAVIDVQRSTRRGTPPRLIYPPVSPNPDNHLPCQLTEGQQAGRSWISPDFFEAASRELHRYISGDRLTRQAIGAFEATRDPKIWTCRFGNVPLLTKIEEPGDVRDDIRREYEIGLILNRLRKRVPNFVHTVATFHANPPAPNRPPCSLAASANDLRYLLLEKVPGYVIRRNRPLEEHLHVLVQLTQALYLAYTEHRFTHYNLHRGNILLHPLEREHVIEYSPRCRLATRTLAVLIDFGRGYTTNTGGRRYVPKGVEDRPAWEHDLTYLFARLLKTYYPAELSKILKFYRLQFAPALSTIQNLATIRQTHPCLRHPDEFLEFIEREFGFQPNDPETVGRLPVMQPAWPEFIAPDESKLLPLEEPSVANEDGDPWQGPWQPGVRVRPAVALKIQRRRYADTAIHEIRVHHEVSRQNGPSPHIIALHEAFLYDGHICTVCEKHGASLDTWLVDGPLRLEEVKSITREILVALTRLHASGFAHSDLKPENILWDRETGVAKLADLGNADADFEQGSSLGTREYLAPEVLLGAPLTPAIDQWALACVVFEMLTGDSLFNPRAAAAEKYREFYFDDDPVAAPEPTPAPVVAESRVEVAEQCLPGTVIHGKYHLHEELGRGRFSTVWSATVLHEQPAGDSFDLLESHGRAVEDARPATTAAEREARAWRRVHGAKDIRDLALNYEHLLLIVRHFGPLPWCLTEHAAFRASYCEPDGQMRFRPAIEPLSIESRLTPFLGPEEADEAARFLKACLQPDPSHRPTAEQAAAAEWCGQQRT